MADVASSSSAAASFVSPRLSEVLVENRPPRPELVYSAVIRARKDILLEHARLTHSGDVQDFLFKHILPRVEDEAEWQSYIYGESTIHFLVDPTIGCLFICMAEKETPRRLAFAFLGSLQEAFKYHYSKDTVDSAIPYGMQMDLWAEVQTLMEKYNSLDADRVVALTEKVQQINDSLMETIEQVMEREEKVDHLVRCSSTLSESSSVFKRDARTLQRFYWWRNTKTILFVLTALFLALAVVILSVR